MSNWNNGILRGVVYQSIGMLTPLGAAFAVWENTPPKNGYAVATVICSVLVAGFNAHRAYIDQHLSRNPNGSEDLDVETSSLSSTSTSVTTKSSSGPDPVDTENQNADKSP